VQGLLSLQLIDAPPWQTPPLQLSPVVQTLPSLQEAVLLTWAQPLPELHESSVHGLLSLQLSAPLPTQAPPLHTSVVVQRLLSLHGAVLLLWKQPEIALQPSSVQGFPSLQLRAGPPTQTPPLHTSPVVQMLPSLQEAALLAWVQPLPVLQASFVQGLLSLQLGAAPPTHTPPAQVSLVVQALPSLHDAVLSVWTHPDPESQESSVQPLPSLQFGAAPPWQVPPPQVSLVVHALPSLHDAVLLVKTQPVAGTHVSVVQTLPSLQVTAVPP
jgi:hypothetical protein